MVVRPLNTLSIGNFEKSFSGIHFYEKSQGNQVNLKVKDIDDFEKYIGRLAYTNISGSPVDSRPQKHK